MMKLVLLLMALAAAPACSKPNASPPPQAKQDAASDLTLYMASVCSTENVASASRHIQLKSVDRSKSQGQEEVCVDQSTQIPLDRDVLHLYPINEGLAYVALSCKDQVRWRSALQAMPAQGEIALVLKDKVFAVYSYLDKEALSANCGVIPMDGLGEALDFCEGIAGGLDRDKGSCSSYCDAKASGALSPVCVVGNAPSPYKQIVK